MCALENKDLKLKYDIIVAKLRAAIARNKNAFPQLTLISTYLDATLADAEGEEDYLQKLEGLCSYLNEMGAISYIVRHLHHNLCADVESAKNNSVFFNQSKDYITMPK
ncbi:hypothetical protein [Pontibacter pamirensis]|uniref:hypothetical protein n=1 Tax=Pontibacter pamirensis TaxID=2562824 RepID=UPI0013897C78|nr:hypothetical protein [Pontibacter pamirensis]